MPAGEEPRPAEGPYAAAAAAYWQAGWRGLLPLPRGRKWPPPDGWTGNDSPDPSWPDVQAWLDGPEAAGNIALRLPLHVVGVDVDAYAGKQGAATLARLEAELGPLPATWRVTARDDGVSGIRLYRVPVGLAWPGQWGPDIEVIRHGHRYAVAWPSVHPEGGTYRWIGPDGLPVIGAVPGVDELPDLPAAWLQAATGGREARDIPRAGLASPAAQAWLQGAGTGTPCRAVLDVLTRAAAELRSRAGSRHEIALQASCRLAYLAAEGHPGGSAALAALRSAFEASTAGERRDPGEWSRLLTGAVDIAAALPRVQLGDPCRNPFAAGATAAVGLTTRRDDPCPPSRPTQPAGSAPAPAGSPMGSFPPTPASSSARSATAPGAGESWPAASSYSPTAGTSSTAPPADPLQDAASTAPERERTSWYPRDLSGLLAGQIEREEPAQLARVDGVAAFYAGRVNGLIAASESGKTWVALHAVLQALGRGQRVLYLDFEDSAAGIVGRLRALGADSTLLGPGRFAYADPDSSLDVLASADLSETLAELEPDLIIVDGVNAAMQLFGLNIEKNNDATQFAQRFLKPLSNTGATVVYVDHLPKNGGKDGDGAPGAIGAQAKRAMTTGCCLRVEIIRQPAPGQIGKLRLVVDKDRVGSVRAVSAGTRTFGTFVIDSSNGGTRTWLEVPAGAVDATTGEARPWRPTTLMRKVAEWLADNPGASQNAVARAIEGKGVHVRQALGLLVEEGYVSVGDGPRGSARHTLARPFQDQDDPLGSDLPAQGSPLPTASHRFPTTSREAVRGPSPTASHRFPHPHYVGGSGKRWPGSSDEIDNSTSEPTASPILKDIDWAHVRLVDGWLVDTRTGEQLRQAEPGAEQ